jgi:hypothetical protein
MTQAIGDRRKAGGKKPETVNHEWRGRNTDTDPDLR